MAIVALHAGRCPLFAPGSGVCLVKISRTWITNDDAIIIKGDNGVWKVLIYPSRHCSWLRGWLLINWLSIWYLLIWKLILFSLFFTDFKTVPHNEVRKSIVALGILIILSNWADKATFKLSHQRSDCFPDESNQPSFSSSRMSATNTKPLVNMNTVLLESRPYRPFKSSEEYLYAMREDLAEWMNTLYPELRINVDNFMDRLDTGVALCKVRHWLFD